MLHDSKCPQFEKLTSPDMLPARMTSTERDYLMFALAVLDGEPGAHKIVADLLEEEGRIGHAQWARSKKSKSRQRLEFAVSLLPADVALRLACDFVEHVLEQCVASEAVLQNRAVFQRAVDDIRAWIRVSGADETESTASEYLEGFASRELDFEISRGFAPWDVQSRVLSVLERIQRALVIAVRDLEAARGLQDAGDDRRARHRSGCAVDAVRKLIRHLGNADLYRVDEPGDSSPGGFHRIIRRRGDDTPAPQHPSALKTAELQWQMAHTRETIETLLASSGDL